MKKSEFENLIAAYGAHPERWPEERRTAGRQYLQENPKAEQHVQTAAALDKVLDYAASTEPSDILKARIMKAATGSVSVTTLQEKPAKQQYWKFAAAFAAVLAVGGLTYSAFTGSTPSVSEDESTIWLETANDLGISDIYEWVEGTE